MTQSKSPLLDLDSQLKKKENEILKLKKKQLELLKEHKKLEEDLPHLYVPMYPWQRKIHESDNRVNLLTAANQIGKSSALIRRVIANGTDQSRWERFWGPGARPKQFWYFYPDSKTLEREIETKWVPEWMPRGRFERDAQYGWKMTKKNGMYNSCVFNAGPIIYFQTYSKAASSVQAGTIHETLCFARGTTVLTSRGRLDVSEVKENDLILSHQGFDRVYSLKNREIYGYRHLTFSDGTDFRCSNEHPFFTQKGWVRAENLTKKDLCFKQSPWLSIVSTLTSCFLKENCTQERTGTKIEGNQITGDLQASIFMLLFGKVTTIEEFLKVTLYIIKTLTRSIIELPISSFLLLKSIREYIKNKNGKKRESTKEFAANVVKYLLQDLLKRQFDFVHKNAEDRQSKGHALDAILNSFLAKNPNSVSVLRNVPIQESIKVYNFSVEKSHTFFANGILTHNCDEEMPLEFYDEIMFRLTATAGIFTSGFTPTLNQLFWKQAMEGNKILPSALKLTVSMYDCLKYEDGSPSRVMTLDKIKLAEEKCKNETEKQRRVYGKFVTEEGRTYYAFDYDENVVRPYSIKDWFIYAAVDYGSGSDEGAKSYRKNHPAAIVFIAVRPDYKKGAVFKSWRGDGEKTTAGDVFLKYQELSRGLRITQACYDPGAADFGTIAQRNGVNFVKADKTRDAGEDLVNTLFKHKMLDIFDDDPENLKLAGELLTIMVSNQRGESKKDDDLADSTRYGCKLIPWDLSAVDELLGATEEAAKERAARPLTEEEHQALQIRMRRGEEIDEPKSSESEGWGELEDEFDHWNAEYS